MISEGLFVLLSTSRIFLCVKSPVCDLMSTHRHSKHTHTHTHMYGHICTHNTIIMNMYSWNLNTRKIRNHV